MHDGNLIDPKIAAEVGRYSPPFQGGVAATSKKMLRSHRLRKRPGWLVMTRSHLIKIAKRTEFSGTYQPPRLRITWGCALSRLRFAQRWLRGIFLIAQPPLLGKEGNNRRGYIIF